MPRTKGVYPSSRSDGYYAVKRGTNGLRGERAYFGHQAHGGVGAAYKAGKAFANDEAPARIETRKSAMVSRRGPGRSRKATTLGKHGVTLHIETCASSRNRFWQVRVTYSAPELKQMKSFAVKKHGLRRALLQAITTRLAWEEEGDTQPSQISPADWVRLMLFVIDRLGIRPVTLDEIPVPGRVEMVDGVVVAQAKSGRAERFSVEGYRDDHDATAAAIIWLLPNTKVSATLPAIGSVARAQAAVQGVKVGRTSTSKEPRAKARAKQRHFTDT